MTLFIVLLVILIAVGAAYYYFFMKKEEGGSDIDKTTPPSQPGSTDMGMGNTGGAMPMQNNQMGHDEMEEEDTQGGGMN